MTIVGQIDDKDARRLAIVILILGLLAALSQFLKAITR